MSAGCKTCPGSRILMRAHVLYCELGCICLSVMPVLHQTAMLSDHLHVKQFPTLSSLKYLCLKAQSSVATTASIIACLFLTDHMCTCRTL